MTEVTQTSRMAASSYVSKFHNGVSVHGHHRLSLEQG